MIGSTALSRADCRPNSAIDVVRGPPVDNAVMCSLTVKTMMARTDLVRDGGSQYVKVVCAPSKNTNGGTTAIEARKAVRLR